MPSKYLLRIPSSGLRVQENRFRVSSYAVTNAPSGLRAPGFPATCNPQHFSLTRNEFFPLTRNKGLLTEPATRNGPLCLVTLFWEFNPKPATPYNSERWPFPTRNSQPVTVLFILSAITPERCCRPPPRFRPRSFPRALPRSFCFGRGLCPCRSFWWF